MTYLLAALLFALPPAFRIPAGYHELTKNQRYYAFETLTVQDLGADGKLHEKKVEGERWTIDTRGDGKQRTDEAMRDLEASLRRDGWTILRDQGALVAKRGVDGTTEWCRAYPNGWGATVLKETPLRRSLTLPPPAAQPEAVPDDRPEPFALPFPGATFKRADHTPHIGSFIPTGAKEPVVLHFTTTKWYVIPNDVSMYEFAKVNAAALEKAGWKVERTFVGSDGGVWAHYARNGRDLWLREHAAGDQESIEVADIGAEASAARLKEELAKNGHAALYGIYFDTDSATPKPESETTLRNVLQLLQTDKALRLEVQGHTDNSGAAQHNAKLSDDRAASVRSWLVAHGIAASRLTSKGYGATKPVADNGSPEGRAKNRRVELVRL